VLGDRPADHLRAGPEVASRDMPIHMRGKVVGNPNGHLHAHINDGTDGHTALGNC
jgi:hypothetical protein